MLLLLFVAAIAGFIVWRYKREQLKINNLKSKAVLVTGCDSGFGRHFALKCLREGMPVYATCLTEQSKQELTDSTRLHPGRLHAFVMDVTSEESVQEGRRFVEKTCGAYKGLHGIVNNAGIASNTALDDWLSLEDYRKVVEVNTFGVILVTQTFKDLVKKTKHCYDIQRPNRDHRKYLRPRGTSGFGPYTVSKHAVEGYCDVIRSELANFGVRVAIIEPGFFQTPMTDPKRVTQQFQTLWDKTSPEIREEYGEKFFKAYQEKAGQMMDQFSSSHPEWVVEAYFHAISAKHPRERYQVGWDANLLFIPLSFLPAGIQTAVMNAAQRFGGFPLPYAVERKLI
ncbi:hypothetical protein L596_015141 [Steinernema carpocapsae]|uniref:Uncharacterized protein n=1 Tax=Steinernema carpocapsae TaxID=34508 RepID=A0A4U5NF00_STECR|nr:hypothetical protein L596_015141 [Steinernema carpocapsae]